MSKKHDFILLDIAPDSVPVVEMPVADLLDLLDVIKTIDDEEDFFDSEKFHKIIHEVDVRGVLRRHPVHTRYVCNVLTGTIYSTIRGGYRRIIGGKGHNGYVKIDVGNKLVYKHKLVLECFLGLPLGDGHDEEIHHYKYTPDKDSILNLRILKKLEHKKLEKNWKKERKTFTYKVKDKSGSVVGVFPTAAATARFLGVTPAAIRNYRYGYQKTVGGCYIDCIRRGTQTIHTADRDGDRYAA